MMPPVKVLDAYAIMAFLEGESGAEKVRQLLIQALHGEVHLLMSVINLGEVYYSVARTNSTAAAEKVIDELLEMPIELVEVNWETAHQAASYKAHAAISYADCFAAALAAARAADVVTGDAEFKKLSAQVNIDWL